MDAILAATLDINISMDIGWVWFQSVISNKQLPAYTRFYLPVVIHAILKFPFLNINFISGRKTSQNFGGIIVSYQP